MYGRTKLGLAVAQRLRQLGANNVIITNFRKSCEMESSIIEQEQKNLETQYSPLTSKSHTKSLINDDDDEGLSLNEEDVVSEDDFTNEEHFVNEDFHSNNKERCQKVSSMDLTSEIDIDKDTDTEKDREYIDKKKKESKPLSSMTSSDTPPKLVYAAHEEFPLVNKAQFLQLADVVCVCDDRAARSQREATFDRSVFRQLKPEVILVNSDSGHALDYSALYEALRDREITAAGLNTCNQGPAPYQQLLHGLGNCAFMTQTQEDRTDLRHRIVKTVTTDLLQTLHT